MKRARIAIALAGVILLAPALTGCGMLEGLVEQASGGAVDISTGSLPEGWPVEVPVADGEIIVGATANTDDGTPGWNATIKVGEGAFATISEQLTAAGFQSVDTGDLTGGAIGSGAFSNGTYAVLVAVTGADDNFIANYTVVEGDPSQLQ